MSSKPRIPYTTLLSKEEALEKGEACELQRQKWVSDLRAHTANDDNFDQTIMTTVEYDLRVVHTNRENRRHIEAIQKLDEEIAQLLYMEEHANIKEEVDDSLDISEVIAEAVGSDERFEGAVVSLWWLKGGVPVFKVRYPDVEAILEQTDSGITDAKQKVPLTDRVRDTVRQRTASPEASEPLKLLMPPPPPPAQKPMIAPSSSSSDVELLDAEHVDTPVEGHSKSPTTQFAELDLSDAEKAAPAPFQSQATANEKSDVDMLD
ncbi:hypothetical protein EJ08DRAFT_431789 [Tothia fuscella]|uniref:Uncharacterized protein n=1 Tax=Tothia fuscella TaxID=1048955 RepID=A0A9P4P062_9PEZI|nr:hypothetical protein EJ08DRAFT_431789 [Tothia fuscella]